MCYVELLLEGFGLYYVLGDVLGVWYCNLVVLVDVFFVMLLLEGDVVVIYDGCE